MPYNSPASRGGQQSQGFSLAANHTIGLLVLAALVILWALRHVFGTFAVSASAGTN